MPLMWMALLVSFIGVLGSLNVVKHLALALSIASFVPWSPWFFGWFATAVSWMPALGWFATHEFPHADASLILSARSFLAVFGVASFFIGRLDD